MADLMKDVNYLRFYYGSDDASKDKDSCKNKAFEQYCVKMQVLFAVPVGFQMWQISVTNVVEKAALYKRIRHFKCAAMLGAVTLGMWEHVNMRKRMTFYDRFYPEPTELQRKLNMEA